LGIGPKALSLEDTNWKAVAPEKARPAKVLKQNFIFSHVKRMFL
jgi:hypothetical protein